MIKKTVKKIRDAGYLPPAIEKRFNPNMREWNEVAPDNWGEKEVTAVLEGRTDMLGEGEVGNGDNTILLCAQPKSASLYISRLVSKVFDAEEYWIGFNKGSGDLYFPRFVGALLNDQLTVSHCHAVADRNVLNILKKTNPKVIVTYRNLADSLISRRDMIVRDKYSGDLMSEKGIERFLESDKQTQTDMVIELYAGQYLNFYSSWLWASKEMDVHFIKYGEFVADQVGEINKLAEDVLEMKPAHNPEDVITEISEGGGVNFNKGKKGRGADQLTDEQRARIRKIAEVYDLADSDYLGF